MKRILSAISIFNLLATSAWAGFEGNANTKYGIDAGFTNTDDTNYNVFIGKAAGYFNLYGTYNTFLGAYSGFSHTNGYDNTFLGYYSGLSNTTGNRNIFIGRSTGLANTTAVDNTFVGSYAGRFNTGGYNTLLGTYAGYSNTSGVYNSFLGTTTGYSNTTGSYNTFMGSLAGYYNTTGNYNTAVGTLAGYNNATGLGNVFLGNAAGQNETGSNRLYISNSSTTTPLIYGEFDNKKVILNGNLEVVGPNAGIVRLTDVTTNSTTKGARLVLNHYNNASLPVYLFGAASTPSQNFLAFGGGNAIGNAATQLDFFTAPTTTTAVGTSRMTINGNGNVGVGVSAPVYPLQMASGALVTAGGVWTNASSREYKENIQSLSNKDAQLTLAKLNPVTYNYKLDNKENHVGFIAEDVPDLVATQDRKGLSPMDIVAVLTKVAQEQQQTIATLTEKVNALEKEARLRASIAMTK